MKARFASSKSEESLETVSESDSNAEGIWDRLQAAGLVPEDSILNEYVGGDTDLITRKTITESIIINVLQS